MRRNKKSNKQLKKGKGKGKEKGKGKRDKENKIIHFIAVPVNLMFAFE